MSRVKTYWDLDEKERHALTGEELKHYMDVDLMKKGLVRPIEPTLPEVPPQPVAETTTYYSVKLDYSRDIVFDTLEKAETFTKMGPFVKGEHSMPSKSYSGNDLTYAKPITDMAIEPKQLSTVAQAEAVKIEWTAWAKKKKDYDEVNDAYQEMVNAVKKIEDAIYEDQTNFERSLEVGRDILKRFNRFLELADNNKMVAARFLLEKFDSEDIVKQLRMLEDEQAQEVATFIDENAEELYRQIEEADKD